MKDTKEFEEILSNSRGRVARFREEYAFLSNFHKCKIKDYEGNVFTSAEALFQSYKTTDPKERAKRRRRRCLTWLCILLILGLVFGILWYKNKLGCIGLARYEEQPVVEQVEEVPAEELPEVPAPEEEAVVDTAEPVAESEPEA